MWLLAIPLFFLVWIIITALVIHKEQHSGYWNGDFYDLMECAGASLLYIFMAPIGLFLGPVAAVCCYLAKMLLYVGTRYKLYRYL